MTTNRADGQPRSTQQGSKTSAERATAVRSVGCECAATVGAPCRSGGDHLARYVHAEKAGAISREELKTVVSGLEVIAPHVLIRGTEHHAGASATRETPELEAEP
jgi:hypothetical protein